MIEESATSYDYSLARFMWLQLWHRWLGEKGPKKAAKTIPQVCGGLPPLKLRSQGRFHHGSHQRTRINFRRSDRPSASLPLFFRGQSRPCAHSNEECWNGSQNWHSRDTWRFSWVVGLNSSGEAKRKIDWAFADIFTYILTRMLGGSCYILMRFM